VGTFVRHSVYQISSSSIYVGQGSHAMPKNLDWLLGWPCFSYTRCRDKNL